ncbi:hypothetical protein F5148DRAFT_1248908 [Russula earlei]|uniref:Uncharacterized protein n=1 Tax=Russula earlei TaxID=71964 RepID=A0ACC0TTW2_9AGAM|nr:hypothetical protein F5148DRAFT_1248908 [Russula earlei]
MIVILAILSTTRATPVPQTSPPHLSLDQFRARAPRVMIPYESRARVAVRRVGLMLAALFVPEAVIGWALRTTTGRC